MRWLPFHLSSTCAITSVRTIEHTVRKRKSTRSEDNAIEPGMRVEAMEGDSGTGHQDYPYADIAAL